MAFSAAEGVQHDLMYAVANSLCFQVPDVLESLFGVGKRLGTGQMKDAGRIASRLPAFCGSFSAIDAKKVVMITVAQQNSTMNCGGSLIKLRRDILPHVGKLETLAQQSDQKNFQLIQGSEVICEVQNMGNAFK